MAKIHISLKKPTNGALAAVTGKLRFQPIGRAKAGTTMIVPEAFEVDLSTSGEATVTLAQTDATFVWAITELPGTPMEYTRYVEIPNTSNTLEYTALVDVQPGSLNPVTMLGGQLLKVMVASSAQAALNLSKQYPDVLVVYTSGSAASSVSSVGAMQSSAVSSVQTAPSVNTPATLPDTIVGVDGATLDADTTQGDETDSGEEQ